MPRPATLESVEKAITETLRERAACAVDGTASANRGPRMISAPSPSACCAPWAAPCGLPPSSLMRSWILGFWNSASAISAAFFMDCAATPALPEADIGKINPTLTWPVPATLGCWAGPAGPGVSELVNWLKVCWMPEQAESSGAPSVRGPGTSRPAAPDLGLNGPTITSLRLIDLDRSGLPP